MAAPFISMSVAANALESSVTLLQHSSTRSRPAFALATPTASMFVEESWRATPTASTSDMAVALAPPFALAVVMAVVSTVASDVQSSIATYFASESATATESSSSAVALESDVAVAPSPFATESDIATAVPPFVAAASDAAFASPPPVEEPPEVAIATDPALTVGANNTSVIITNAAICLMFSFSIFSSPLRLYHRNIL